MDSVFIPRKNLSFMSYERLKSAKIDTLAAILDEISKKLSPRQMGGYDVIRWVPHKTTLYFCIVIIETWWVFIKKCSFCRCDGHYSQESTRRGVTVSV